MPKINISNEAADCLAFFVGDFYYGDTISEVIISHTKEWFFREDKKYEECVGGDFKSLKKEAIK